MPVTIGPMPTTATSRQAPSITNFAELAQRADYSLIDSLRADPQATVDGQDHRPRQVMSGHYVPVTPKIGRAHV